MPQDSLRRHTLVAVMAEGAARRTYHLNVGGGEQSHVPLLTRFALDSHQLRRGERTDALPHVQNTDFRRALRPACQSWRKRPRSDVPSDRILLRLKLRPKRHNVNFTLLDKVHLTTTKRHRPRRIAEAVHGHLILLERDGDTRSGRRRVDSPEALAWATVDVRRRVLAQYTGL